MNIKPLCMTTCLLAATFSAQATVITFTDAFADGVTVDQGSAAVTGTDIETVYTVSGLTIDDDGTANDTVAVILSVSGRFDVVYDDVAGRYEYSDGSIIGGSDWMEFELSLQSYTLSDATKTLQSDFSITGIDITNGGTSDGADITLDDGTPYNVFPLSSGVHVPQTTGASKLLIARTGNSFSFADVNFTLDTTAVPEPTTIGLMVAMSGGILFIRRRFMM